MKRKSKSHQYHHGHLREALIQAAVRFLARKPVEQLSLRTLAAQIGVSQAAPYRHFRDRHALLAAISQQGFELKFKYMMDACHRHWEEPLELLHACAQAYFHMGLAHPQHFGLMLSSAMVPSDDFPELERSAGMTYALLKKMIVRCQLAQVVGPGDPYHKAMHCWSVVNGFTALYASGHLKWLGVDDSNAPEALRVLMEQFRLGHQSPLPARSSFRLFGTSDSSGSLVKLQLAEAALDEVFPEGRG